MMAFEFDASLLLASNRTADSLINSLLVVNLFKAFLNGYIYKAVLVNDF